MSFDAATVAQLRKKIAELRLQSTDLMAGGRCADFSEYRYSVGYVASLDDVVKLIDETQTDLQKG